MAGKRSWYVVHKHLMQAASNKATKGDALDSILFIPETFSVERKDEILQRRLAKLSRVSAPAQGTRKLMMLIGEVKHKQIERSRYGKKLVIKHLPDMPFMVAEDLHKRLVKRFASDLALWEADESTHLIVIGTFGFNAAGFASIEEMAVIVTTANWIPMEHAQDMQLLDALTQSGRRFTKGLRYNLASTRPLASAVVSDTTPRTVALYVVPPNASDEYQRDLADLVNESDLASWVWRSGETARPELPPLHDYQPATSEQMESATQ
jgi:hypothetical protein